MGEPVGVYIFWLGIVANIRQGQACYCFHVLLVPSFLMKQAPHCPSLKIGNFDFAGSLDKCRLSLSLCYSFDLMSPV